VQPLPIDRWHADGADTVVFEVATNPGSAPGPLNKIASGGELSRFLLALKVVLAGADPIATLIFDEVDSGVGGAVADAVGERLALLGQELQILVVTHSPQVAARGGQHLRVAKAMSGGQMVTDVARLSADERREEVARMLAGSNVTDAARAAADQLLQDSAQANT
jgi:DNA repair protein RecN (Recombination protein N)